MFGTTINQWDVPLTSVGPLCLIFPFMVLLHATNPYHGVNFHFLELHKVMDTYG